MKENMLKTNVTEDEDAEIKNYAYNTYLMFKMFDEEHVKQLIGENNPYVNDREKNMIYINTLLIPNDVEFINDMDILKKEELKEKYEVGDITIYQKMLEHHAFE